MTTTAPTRPSTYLAAKVPAITVLFWILKTLTTGMGEALSDFLANTNLVAAIAIGVLGLAAALWVQLRTRRYSAPVYWLAVAMVAVFGTMAADGVHLVGMPYALTTTFYLLVVGALFFAWHRSEGTLSIHSITTRRRELFYWATVLASFALGTAAGDWTADQLQLGYLPSVAIFAVAIAVPAIGWRFFRLNPVIAFWVAYVLTRPLGASIADWLGKPASHGGGLGLGDGTVAGVALVVIAVLVGYLAVRRTDIQTPDPPRGVTFGSGVPAVVRVVLRTRVGASARRRPGMASPARASLSVQAVAGLRLVRQRS